MDSQAETSILHRDQELMCSCVAPLSGAVPCSIPKAITCGRVRNNSLPLQITVHLTNPADPRSCYPPARRTAVFSYSFPLCPYPAMPAGKQTPVLFHVHCKPGLALWAAHGLHTTCRVYFPQKRKKRITKDN